MTYRPIQCSLVACGWSRLAALWLTVKDGLQRLNFEFCNPISLHINPFKTIQTPIEPRIWPQHINLYYKRKRLVRTGEMATVILGDLDDFIAPGQACINPLFVTPEDTKRAKEAAAESSNGGSGKAAMQLVLEDDGGPVDAMNVSKIQPARDFITAVQAWITLESVNNIRRS